MELFTNFFGTDDYSNTADLWDSVPKHCVTARKQVAMRDENGRLPVFEHAFEFRNTACRVELMPALVRDKDGTRRDHYPSQDEELVEEVLRKLFADQRYGLHDAQESESWVRFTLSMVRRELKTRGRTRSLDEIKKSLEIMTLSSVRIFIGDSLDPVYTGSIFSDVTRVSRQTYLDDGSAMWAARLPALISKSVNDHSYRQFNYRVLMELRSPLARWLHKRLSHRFTYAHALKSFSMSFRSMQRDSALLSNNRITKDTRAVEAALDELVTADVLNHWTKDERRGTRNALEDVVYTLHGSVTFNTEMRRMNARHQEIDAALGNRRGGGVGAPRLPSR